MAFPGVLAVGGIVGARRYGAYMHTADALEWMPGLRMQAVHESENLAQGAKQWTHFHGGAFKRSGRWFADVTPALRTRGSRPYHPWRVTATPAIQTDRPAKVGQDMYRHQTDGATDLGEFLTYAKAIRAAERWLKAQNREPPGLPWVGRADW